MAFRGYARGGASPGATPQTSTFRLRWCAAPYHLSRNVLGVLAALFAPADAGVDEAVQVAVEDRARVADLVLGAEVLHHLVRREHVGADLVAPARRDVAGELLLLRVLLLLLEQEQARREHPHGGGPVLDLALLVLHRHHRAGREMRDAHGRVGRVDRLAAGAA